MATHTVPCIDHEHNKDTQKLTETRRGQLDCAAAHLHASAQENRIRAMLFSRVEQDPG